MSFSSTSSAGVPLSQRDRVKVIFSYSHQRSRCQLMSSDPLPDSIPMIRNGKTSRISSTAANTHLCALLRTLRFLV